MKKLLWCLLIAINLLPSLTVAGLISDTINGAVNTTGNVISDVGQTTRDVVSDVGHGVRRGVDYATGEGPYYVVVEEKTYPYQESGVTPTNSMQTSGTDTNEEQAPPEVSQEQKAMPEVSTDQEPKELNSDIQMQNS